MNGKSMYWQEDHISDTANVMVAHELVPVIEKFDAEPAAK